MGESFARGDFLVKRSTPVIDSNLDICPGNVGGHIVPLPFSYQIADTVTNQVMKFIGSTNSKAVAYKSGSIVGLSVYANTVLATDMHFTATVFVGATSTGFGVTLNSSGSQSTYTSQDKDTDTFTAGKAISVKLNSDTMVTSTLGVVVFAEM